MAWWADGRQLTILSSPYTPHLSHTPTLSRHSAQHHVAGLGAHTGADPPYAPLVTARTLNTQDDINNWYWLVRVRTWRLLVFCIYIYTQWVWSIAPPPPSVTGIPGRPIYLKHACVHFPPSLPPPPPPSLPLYLPTHPHLC